MGSGWRVVELEFWCPLRICETAGLAESSGRAMRPVHALLCGGPLVGRSALNSPEDASSLRHTHHTAPPHHTIPHPPRTNTRFPPPACPSHGPIDPCLEIPGVRNRSTCCLSPALHLAIAWGQLIDRIAPVQHSTARPVHRPSNAPSIRRARAPRVVAVAAAVASPAHGTERIVTYIYDLAHPPRHQNRGIPCTHASAPTRVALRPWDGCRQRMGVASPAKPALIDTE